MPMLYFACILVLIFLILKKIIVRQKRTRVYKRAAVIDEKDTVLYAKKENIPYLYYNDTCSVELITLKRGECMNVNMVFYIESGSICIKQNEKQICIKRANDTHFYALSEFNENKVTMKVLEDTKIWNINRNCMNKYTMLCSLKKKVIEVMSDFLHIDNVFIEQELNYNNTHIRACGMSFAIFVTEIIRAPYTSINCIKTCRLHKNEKYKKVKFCMNDVIFVEEGNLVIRFNDKLYDIEKGSVFGYLSLFFNCYYDIEIYCTQPSVIKTINSNSMKKLGLSLLNFNIDIFKNMPEIIHYIDLCTDWRILQRNEIVSTQDILFINEGLYDEIQDEHVTTYKMHKQNDVIVIKNDIIEHALTYNVSLHKHLFDKRKPTRNKKLVTIISNETSLDISLFCKRLHSSIGKGCVSLDKKDFTFTFDSAEELRVNDYINGLTRANKIVLANISNKYSRIAKFMYKISDVVLVVGREFDKEVDYCTVKLNDKDRIVNCGAKINACSKVEKTKHAQVPHTHENSTVHLKGKSNTFIEMKDRRVGMTGHEHDISNASDKIRDATAHAGWIGNTNNSSDDNVNKNETHTSENEGYGYDNMEYGNVEYVKLYESQAEINLSYKNSDKLNSKTFVCHHVLSPRRTILFSTKDYDRLGRHLLGKKIGLVLSGGGARGLAHIGVIQALEEEGIPIDIIGGTSMGAFIGALYSKKCDNGFVFKESKKFCVKGRNIFHVICDMTYPLISFFKGGAINAGLKKLFGNDLIQNLWLDFFCVSTNLSTSDQEVHTSGLIWKYLRASMGLCGYLPPVVDRRGFLVDGGYMNNVPVDVMLKMNVYRIIAVDVGSLEDNDYDDHDDCFNGFVGLVHKLLGIRRYITMEEIQYRLAFLTSEQKLRGYERNRNVFLIRPDLGNISTMDFKRMDEIVASGYVSAKKVIRKWKEDGTYDTHFSQRKQRLWKRRYSV